jgi:fructose-1,6-bisphosphatase/inositol monophosphatase family enzyme
MASTVPADAIPEIDLEHLENTHTSGCEMIKALYRPQSAQGKNDFGEAVTDLDIVVQKYFAWTLRGKYGDEHVLVGEEQTPDHCSSKFPDPIRTDANIWAIDPVDGSKILATGSAMCSTVIGFQKGRTPILGSARTLAGDGTYIVGGKYWPVTINGQWVTPPRDYNSDNVEIAYGLGKRKSVEEKDHFIDQLKRVTSEDKMDRPGHLTLSCTRLLRGEADAYMSLKEEWYKFAAWYAIMTKAGFVTNIDPETVDMNDAFCAWFATPEFAAEHLQPDGDLAKCMTN